MKPNELTQKLFYGRSGVTRAMATAYYHWFFLPSGNGLPEHLIGALADFLD